MVVWQMEFRTETQSHGARAWSPSLNFPEFASPLTPACWTAGHIICNPKNWCYRNTFSLSEGHFATNPRFRQKLGGGGKLHRGPLGGLSNKGGSKVPPLHPAPTRDCTASGVWLWGQHWDFTDLDPHCPLCYPAGLVTWDQNDQITEEVSIFPRNTGHFSPYCKGLKSQSARALKNFRFIASYWKTIERLLINLLEN